MLFRSTSPGPTSPASSTSRGPCSTRASSRTARCRALPESLPATIKIHGTRAGARTEWVPPDGHGRASCLNSFGYMQPAVDVIAAVSREGPSAELVGPATLIDQPEPARHVVEKADIAPRARARPILRQVPGPSWGVCGSSARRCQARLVGADRVSLRATRTVASAGIAPPISMPDRAPRCWSSRPTMGPPNAPPPK